MESLHSSQVTALPGTPCQNTEMRKQDVAHQREMALNTLSEIANVFDFPDLNRFLTVSYKLHNIVDLIEVFNSIFCVYSRFFKRKSGKYIEEHIDPKFSDFDFVMITLLV